MATLEERLKAQALAEGFDLAGIVRAEEADGFAHFQEWLAHDYAGSMDYLHEDGAARQHPRSILSTVRCVLMLARNYCPGPEEPDLPPHHGRVARYARGQDYHPALWKRLNALAAWLQREVPGCRARGVADTAPLLERDFARRAGLGWFGKNAMLLNRSLGSYFFLAGLLTDLELTPDAPHETDHCGTCTACLDACPTEAFVSPRVLDARKCISYLTIEHRPPVEEAIRPGLGEWVFGCDVCQEVCPWNRKAPTAADPVFRERLDLHTLDLVEVLQMDEATFRARFRGTALMRARRVGVLRSAAIVLGNRGDPAALPVLEKALLDPEEQIREAAAWAIATIRARHLQEREIVS
jgi:epoxyqueuosine reductase